MNRILLLLDRFPEACVMPSITRGMVRSTEITISQASRGRMRIAGTNAKDPAITPVQREQTGRARPETLKDRSGIP